MKIIIDAMGGDNAPRCNVEGALAAVREQGVEAVLVGRGDELLSILQELGHDDPPPGLEIVHASEVVGWKTTPPRPSRRRRIPL